MKMAIRRDGPDRGHAWVIAIAAGAICMILSGLSKTVSILYVAVIDTYGVSRQEATLPFTLRKSFRSLSGPIVGVVGQRFGVRAVTLGGAFLAALGSALCFMAPNVTWLAACWGGLFGLGEAFSIALFQVIVNQYFVKYKSTASGIALSGVCIGSVFFSFLIEATRDAYGLQGTFLIFAGVILNVVPAAILLKPPSWSKTGAKPGPKGSVESPKSEENTNKCISPDNIMKSNDGKKMSSSSIQPYLLEKNEILNVANLPVKAHSTTNLVESLENNLKGEKGCDNLAISTEKLSNIDKHELEKRLSIQENRLSMEKSTSKESVYDTVLSISNLKPEICIEEEKEKVNVVESEKTQPQAVEKKKPQSIKESIWTIARLYSNPVYVLICAYMAASMLAYTPVMTTILDYSKDKGLPETVGKYLVHAMAAGDILGRLCFGWVTDKKFLSIPKFMFLASTFESLFILLFPVSSSLPAFMILIVLCTMTSGSIFVQLPVIVLKHVKKEESSVAMGCYGFVSGLVPFVVPYIIGYFRDGIGSYDGMFYMLGTLSVISGGFWLLEPKLAKLSERWKTQSKDITNA